MMPLVATSYATLLALATTAGLGAPRNSAEAAARLARAAEVAPLDASSARPVDLRSWGSLSLGEPNRGRLINGVRLTPSPLFELVTPDQAWGTEETISSLKRAVEAVHARYPKTPPLHIGHISAAGGGKLKPHLSHQAGRDVDVGFYYSGQRAWYRRGTADNLDLPRTWALIRALIVESDVEFILVDRSLHSSLRKEAARQGDPPAWLDSVFRGQGALPALIRHARGHTTHLHVRFFSPVARQNAERAYPILLEQKLVEPAMAFTYYKVRNGDTLGRLSARFHVSIEALRAANDLHGSAIRAGRTYRIPRPGVAVPTRHFVCPPRRLPEAFASAAAGHGQKTDSANSSSQSRPEQLDEAGEDDSLLDSSE
jgi:penicillin-insensitive murein endopeptidase